MEDIRAGAEGESGFRPTLILVQLRLGADVLNPIYIPDLKVHCKALFMLIVNPQKNKFALRIQKKVVSYFHATRQKIRF